MMTSLQGPAIEAMIVLAIISFGAGGVMGAMLMRTGKPAGAPPGVDLNLLIGLLHKLVAPASTSALADSDMGAIHKGLDETISRLGSLISTIKKGL